jgi:predicted nucleic acid-binding protein
MDDTIFGTIETELTTSVLGKNRYTGRMTESVKHVYVDTSVVLGTFDPDETRREQTAIFWQAVKNDEIVALISDILDDEVKDPSENVRGFLAGLPESQIKWINATIESNTLARQYIDAKVVSENSLNDCRHVALATIENAGGIVSWNLHDMVKRADRYNSVNMAQKYHKIKIVTPDRYKEIDNAT